MTERSSNRGRKRLGAAALITAMGAASVAGINPALAAPPPAQSTEEFCANVPEANPFSDVSDNVDNIVCMAFTEITTGLAGGTTYGPGNTVTRAQMASFIARMIDTAGELSLVDVPELPATGADAFTDDNGLAPHEANINRLAAAKVVAGIGGGLYAPDQPVTRAQMATFINNAQAFLGSGEANRFTSSEDYFTDDEAQTAHEANINGLAGAGIVQGGPGGIAQTLYGPVLPVNRSQMASFVIRYLGVLEDAGTIKPAGTPPTNQTITVTPAEATSVPVVNTDGNGAPDGQADNRLYTVAGLTKGKVYMVALVDSASITNTNGVYSFTSDVDDADAAYIGQGPNYSAGIVQVSGGANVEPSPAPNNPQALVLVTDPGDDGTITVLVDAVTFGSVSPVVFEAPAGAQQLVLDIDADGKPTEAFGVGGAFSTLPPEALSNEEGESYEGEVIGVDKQNNMFAIRVLLPDDPDGATVDATMIYGDDPDDEFLAPAGPSLTTFEAHLSTGDTIEVHYQRGSDERSSFAIEEATDKPSTPTIAVPAPSSTSARIDISDINVGSTARVYLVKGKTDVEFADATEVASAYAPQGATSIVVGNLEPSTDYTVFARQDVDGQPSDPTVGTVFKTTATPSQAITIQSVSIPTLTSVVVTLSGDVDCVNPTPDATRVVNSNSASEVHAAVSCNQPANSFKNRVTFTLDGGELKVGVPYTLTVGAGDLKVAGANGANLASQTYSFQLQISS